MQRHKTSLPGLFYEIRPCRVDRTKKEKAWVGRFPDPNTGKERAVTLGREISDMKSQDEAYVKLVEFKSGKGKTITEQRLEAKEKALEQQKNIDDLRKSTCKGIWESYICTKDDAGKMRSEKSIFITDKGYLNKHILPYFGNKLLTNITVEDIHKFKFHLQEKEYEQKIFDPTTGKTQIVKRNYKNQTIKHVLALLRRLLKHYGIILDFKMPVVKNKVTEDLTPDELQRLLKAIKESPDKLVANMMLFVLCTGCRQIEVRKLQWKDVDFHRKRLTLRDRKCGDDLTIPMSRKAGEILNNQQIVGTTMHADRYVFSRTGKMIGQICRISRKIRDAAGLPQNFRPMHGLRHYYLTELASRKVDLETVRKLAGHASLSTTERYIEARDDRMIEAVEIMGDMINEAL